MALARREVQERPGLEGLGFWWVFGGLGEFLRLLGFGGGGFKGFRVLGV